MHIQKQTNKQNKTMRSGTCRKFPKSVHICLLAAGANNAITNHSKLETGKEIRRVSSGGKRATGAERGKTCNRCETLNAERCVTDVKRGKICNRKTCNRCEALNAERCVTDVKRGKICKRCWARENMQAVSSAGKYATGSTRGKTWNRWLARGNVHAVTISFDFYSWLANYTFDQWPNLGNTNNKA